MTTFDPDMVLGEVFIIWGGLGRLGPGQLGCGRWKWMKNEDINKHWTDDD